MFGTRSPSDAVVRVEFDSGLALLLVDQLETVVVDENVRRATLQFVRGDGLLDRLDGWRDDGCKTFLVHRALDGDVGKVATLNATWKHGRVVARVHRHLAYGTDALRNATNDDLSEELEIRQQQTGAEKRQIRTSVKKTWMGVRMRNARRM